MSEFELSASVYKQVNENIYPDTKRYKAKVKAQNLARAIAKFESKLVLEELLDLDEDVVAFSL